MEFVSHLAADGTPDSNQTKSEVINLDSDEEEIQSIKYRLVEFPDGLEKRIPEHYMASGFPTDPNEQIPPETRVIARRKQRYFPVRLYNDDSNCPQLSPLCKNDDSAFHAGIISYKKVFRKDCYHYLVFFDDGHVQYVASKNIRVVIGNHDLKYVHENARKFYDFYFNNGQSECFLPEVECAIGNKLRVFSNNKLEMAEVHKYSRKKPGLFLLYFRESHTAEWLYTGSPRIRSIWELLVKNKKLKRYHQANTTLIEVSSDSEEEDDDQPEQPKKERENPPENASDLRQKIVRLRPESLIDNYKPTRKLDRHHTCGRGCVRDNEMNHQIYDFDPLKRPLLAGWTRKRTGTCCYIAPCGRPFIAIETLYKYLKITNSKLSIDCFTFSSDIDCLTEVHSVSKTGQEQFLNDVS